MPVTLLFHLEARSSGGTVYDEFGDLIEMRDGENYNANECNEFAVIIISDRTREDHTIHIDNGMWDFLEKNVVDAAKVVARGASRPPRARNRHNFTVQKERRRRKFDYELNGLGRPVRGPDGRRKRINQRTVKTAGYQDSPDTPLTMTWAQFRGICSRRAKRKLNLNQRGVDFWEFELGEHRAQEVAGETVTDRPQDSDEDPAPRATPLHPDTVALRAAIDAGTF